ncbi:S53 family peptidase [Phaeacidiphilus oryzae]|uniref:S53 family peptidase n=1 Tax=Phaeacidiphilus oryzae TaxID=348818 RepID=UPI00056C5692|nr:S53 family peptidase [Phaeacidiphilus oryzae]
MRTRHVPLAVAGVAALAISGLAAAVPAGAATSATTPALVAAPNTGVSHGVAWARACASTTSADAMSCNALRVTGRISNGKTAKPNASSPSGYGPSNLLSAYKLASGGGAGQTVAIVDAYDDPNAEADMATYRSYYGLPACTSASGCFKKVGQTGGSVPRANASWAEEISLDLDMVSAIAPNAHIVLVEASSASMTNLGTAVNEAVKLGATEVSNSYGGGESSSDTGYDSTYFNHPGVPITVSSGDSGYGVEYPAASPNVTAVGGTSLKTASNTRGWTESVWSTSSTEGAGSGCSAYEPKPSWQTDSGCSKRTVADVSAVADPATGVSVYDSYGSVGGWATFGGTSVAAPLIASVYADAGSHSTSVPASVAYSHSSSLFDVTSGSTTSCSPAYLCTAESGYDGPTGLGTPNGTAAFTG